MGRLFCRLHLGPSDQIFRGVVPARAYRNLFRMRLFRLLLPNQFNCRDGRPDTQNKIDGAILGARCHNASR
jgi:hypothetical protein